MKLLIVSIFIITVTNAAVDQKTVQNAVNAFKQINTAENIGKLIRVVCGESSQAQSLVESLQNAPPAGLACFYNSSLSTVKGYKGTKNVDFKAILTKVQSNAVSKCAQSISGFAQAIPVLTQILASPPSVLIVNYNQLPASAQKVANMVSTLMNQTTNNPSFANSNNYKTQAKDIVTAINGISQADRQSIVNLYPQVGSFLIKGQANFQSFNNYLTLVTKDLNGKLKKADKKKMQTVAVKLVDAVVNILVAQIQNSPTTLANAVVPDSIKSDGAVNTAIQKLAPFFVQVGTQFVSNPNFVSGCVTLSQQVDAVAKKYPNFITLCSTLAQNKLDTSSITFPWKMLP
ncbi:hypothetical protein FO519_004897 [Halicephalobus sp. NKZ332]|nr:hypothetical protein FO519_004897 [Halicephalobus sp. NKZ332]